MELSELEKCVLWGKHRLLDALLWNVGQRGVSPMERRILFAQILATLKGIVHIKKFGIARPPSN